MQYVFLLFSIIENNPKTCLYTMEAQQKIPFGDILMKLFSQNSHLLYTGHHSILSCDAHKRET
jgi:hypothetical protein